MAVDNLKDFSMQWIMFGLLFFSLLTFTMLFMFNNSPDALGTSEDKFDTYSSDIKSKLVIVVEDSNSLLNISAQNDPEASTLGSKDSVATSYGITGISRSFLSSMKLFMGWIITGDAGKVLVSIFVGMFGILSIYFITKWIRNGI